MEKLQLSALLGACLEFKAEPTDQRKAVIDKMLSDMQIVSYLAQKYKETCLIAVLSVSGAENANAVAMGINLSVAKIIYGLLPYVINLENDLDFAALNAGAVDLLYEMGIVSYILNICKDDYERLVSLIDSTVNFSNLLKLADLANVFTPDNVDKFTETVRDLRTELTPEKLKELNSIVAAGSVEWKALKETVADDAISNMMEQEFHRAGFEEEEPVEKQDNENKA